MISGCSQWYWSKTLFDWVNEIANPLLCYILHRKHRKMADELPDDFDVIVLGTGMLCDYKLFNVIKLKKQIYRLP